MTISKVSNLNSLFNNIYEGSRFVLRQTDLMVGLVRRANSDGMAPRILPQYTVTTAGAVSEGSATSITNFAKTAQGTITPAIVAWRGQLTDERIATDPDDAARDLAREAALAIQKKRDSDLVSLADDFTAFVGTAGAAPTLAHAQLAMARLVQANALGRKSAVVGAGQWYEISKELTQTGNNSFSGMYGNVGEEALREYGVGRFLGMGWFINTNIGTTGTAGTAFGMIFDEDAIIYDERLGGLQFETERIPAQRAFDLNWSLRYGYGIYRDDHGVEFRTRNYLG